MLSNERVIARGFRLGFGMFFGLVAAGLLAVVGSVLVYFWGFTHQVSAEQHADAPAARPDEGSPPQSFADVLPAGLKVELVWAAVARPRVTSSTKALGELIDRSELLVTMKIANLGGRKKYDYRSWGSHFVGAFVTDQFGNTYKRLTYGVGRTVEGQANEQSLYPGDSLDDLLVFQAPVDNARELCLNLPLENLGLKGMLKLTVPPERWNIRAPEKWLVATRQPARDGNFLVLVKSVSVDHATGRIEGEFQRNISTQKFLIVTVVLGNAVSFDPVFYRPWQESGATLTDARGVQQVAHIRRNAGGKAFLIDSVTKFIEKLDTSKPQITENIYFNLPTNAGPMKLELSRKNFGGDGVLRFTIPEDVVTRPLADQPQVPVADNAAVAAAAEAARQKLAADASRDSRSLRQEVLEEEKQALVRAAAAAARAEAGAAVKLRSAKEQMDAGRKDAAKFRLEQILERYPKTAAAAEAKKLLKSLDQ